MDGVLVRQTGSDGFDKMPWMPDGRDLWDFIKQFEPSLLSQLPDETYARCAPQKIAWAARELGAYVSALIVKRSIGKARDYANPDAILIDDAAYTHGKLWTAAGGQFIHHVTSAKTIQSLRGILG